ncbi:MAG: hypothetical protein KDA91_20360 [Planctomycetaceae bacterium]|nr:hypothetical protein [Planctomycetaceae bacterium]
MRFAKVILFLFVLSGCTSRFQDGKFHQSDLRPTVKQPDLHFFNPDKGTPRTDAKNDSEQPLSIRMQKLAASPLTQEEREKVLETAASNFAYGPGLGETALDVTGAVLFPPYAIVLAGQAVLALTGNDSPRISDALPEEDADTYQSVMDAVYSGPGRIVSFFSGEDYRSRKQVKERWDAVVTEIESGRGQESSPARTPQPKFFPRERSDAMLPSPAPRYFAPGGERS